MTSTVSDWYSPRSTGYTLTDDDAARITTPMLITDPDDENFWPGQSRYLADRAGGRTELSPFTAAEDAASPRMVKSSRSAGS
ncbi:hypothetical protein RQN9TF_32255 (plasmid) [Rhodococcus qingshengii]|uniref:hypothetical protein n=1 Tax=Rhodococcus TaxID=1827 RepID=UPI001F14DD68|nr:MULTISPECIES: hypothetical protein [Rhodococcus]BDQ23932.1 hypothetical protein RQN9TF_32255 [Rhodococcus qingshengii]